MNIKTLAALFLLVAVWSAPLVSQNIVTDRPDQTESAITIPVKHLQFEWGMMLENDRIGGKLNNHYQFTGLLIRYGLFENLELRLGGDYSSYHWRSPDPENPYTQTGLEPLNMGAKISILKETGLTPDLAMIVTLTLPGSGLNEFRIAHLAPAILLAGSHSLTDYLTLGVNLGAEWESNAPRATGYYSVVLGFSISDRLGTYAESYGWISKDGAADYRVDAGFTYLLSPTMQLDLSAGLGLSENSPDYFVSAGFSFRIPN